MRQDGGLAGAACSVTGTGRATGAALGWRFRRGWRAFWRGLLVRRGGGGWRGFRGRHGAFLCPWLPLGEQPGNVPAPGPLPSSNEPGGQGYNLPITAPEAHNPGFRAIGWRVAAFV